MCVCPCVCVCVSMCVCVCVCVCVCLGRHLLEVEPRDVVERLLIVADVLELDLEVPVVLLVLLGQVEGVLVVPRRPAHLKHTALMKYM